MADFWPVEDPFPFPSVRFELHLLLLAAGGKLGHRALHVPGTDFEELSAVV